MTTILASGGIGAGTVGLLVVLALAVAGALLFRSMTRQLRKLPRSFDPPADEDAGRRPAEPTATAPRPED